MLNFGDIKGKTGPWMVWKSKQAFGFLNGDNQTSLLATSKSPRITVAIYNIAIMAIYFPYEVSFLCCEKQTPLDLFWNALETSLTLHCNFLETPRKRHWHTQHPWNFQTHLLIFYQILLKRPSILLETPLKLLTHPWHFPETSLKHSGSFLETLWKLPWNTF